VPLGTQVLSQVVPFDGYCYAGIDAPSVRMFLIRVS